MKTKTFAATELKQPQAIDFIEDCISEGELGTEDLMKLLVACEEVFVNIARYAYNVAGNATGDVEIQVDTFGDDITITFIDSGVRFDPLKNERETNTLSQAEREEKGMGLFMARKLVTQMDYSYVGSKNVLTIKKAKLMAPRRMAAKYNQQRLAKSKTLG
jgi:anti-sigma regulatory factor (Ser/Thr protein kinase)